MSDNLTFLLEHSEQLATVGNVLAVSLNHVGEGLTWVGAGLIVLTVGWFTLSMFGKCRYCGK